MRHASIVLSGLLSLSCPAVLHAQCTPERVPFTEPGGIVSMTTFQGSLVVGGPATAPFKYVGLWNGTAWQSFATGPGVTDEVIVYNGELIATGAFAGNVKRWNGTAWQVLGTGVTSGTAAASSVSAVTIYNGELIVGGKFQMAGGQPARNIAAWNGASWRPLGTGCNKEVVSLTVFDGDLIAGGELTEAGGLPMNHIARWDGSAWSAIGSGVDGVAATMTVYRGELYAAGTFQTTGGVPAPLVARFDGSSWTPVGGGLMHAARPYAGVVTAITVYRDQLIVAGNFTTTADGTTPLSTLARWTGEAWIDIPGTVGGFPWTAYIHDDAIYAAGNSLSCKLRRYACPPCLADINGDGYVDFVDYLEFADLHAAADPAADLNDDGFVDASDWLVFFDVYSTGC